MKLSLLILSFFILSSCAYFPHKVQKYDLSKVQCKKPFKVFYQDFEVTYYFNSEVRFTCKNNNKCFDKKGKRLRDIEKDFIKAKKLSKNKPIKNILSKCIKEVNNFSDADFIFKSKYTIHEEGSLIWAGISGFSLGIIPMHAEMKHTRQSKISSKNTSHYKEIKVSNSHDLWFSIFLLPFTPFYTEEKASNIDINNYIYEILKALNSMDKSNNINFDLS